MNERGGAKPPLSWSYISKYVGKEFILAVVVCNFMDDYYLCIVAEAPFFLNHEELQTNTVYIRAVPAHLCRGGFCRCLCFYDNKCGCC